MEDTIALPPSPAAAGKGTAMEAPPFAMSLNDAARWIGVSRSTIYRLVARGEIPRIKIGRRTVVLSSHLAEFLHGQEQIGTQAVGS